MIRLGILLSFVLAMPVYSEGPKPSDPNPEFYFTRLAYTDTRGRGPGGFFGRLGGGAWQTDAWEADFRYMWGIQRLTNVRLYMEPHPLPIMSPELFQYPYVYAVEVGQMELDEEEAARIREYLQRGGFLHVDDFWGLRQFAQFKEQMDKVFPDRRMEVLPMTHEIFHIFYDIDKIMQVPNVRNGEAWKRSGGRTPTWQSADDTVPRVLGISDDQGRLMVLVTYNSDLGDAWEWMDDPDYPAEFTGYAYRLGMNSIIYAMSH